MKKLTVFAVLAFDICFISSRITNLLTPNSVCKLECTWLEVCYYNLLQEWSWTLTCVSLICFVNWCPQLHNLFVIKRASSCTGVTLTATNQNDVIQESNCFCDSVLLCFVVGGNSTQNPFLQATGRLLHLLRQLPSAPRHRSVDAQLQCLRQMQWMHCYEHRPFLIISTSSSSLSATFLNFDWHNLLF